MKLAENSTLEGIVGDFEMLAVNTVKMVHGSPYFILQIMCNRFIKDPES